MSILELWLEAEDRSPRRWQAEATEAIAAWLREPEVTHGLVRAVTGAGKSSVIGWVCMWSAEAHDAPVLVTVPTQALVVQTADAIRRWLPSGAVGEYYADRKEPDADVVVCCIPSVPALLAERQARPFALWVADEAHRSEAATLLQVAEQLPDTRRLGFTATPFRASSSERLSLFDSLLYDYGPAQALRDGVLVPLEVVPYEGASQSLDDAVLWAMERATKHGPTVVNAASIADAEATARMLQEAGYRAEAIHSRLSATERSRRLEALRTRELDALVHVSLLAEGVDMPWLSCLVARRPVSSRIRWIQEIGRVLRTAEGKDRAFLYDLLDQWSAFALTYDAVLGAETPQERQARLMDAVVQAEPMQSDDDRRTYEEMLQAAVLEADPQALRPLSAAIRRLAAEVEQRSASTKIKSRSWRKKPITDRQAAFLERRPWTWRWCSGASEEQRRLLETLGTLGAAGKIDRGTASDLITVLMHPKEHRYKWLPWRNH